MLYHVYLWKNLDSEAAEVVEKKRAWHPDGAIQSVMRQHGLPYIHYAWVVPQNERVSCAERFAVRCPAVRCRRGA